jgi:hypothetical protein
MTTYQAPYAAVLCSINGGTATAGAQTTTTTGATIQFSAANSTGWVNGLWELYDYPPGYVTPSGWSLNALSGALQYQATSGSPNPPVITQQFWGKIACRLTVNGGLDPTNAFNPPRMIDTSCAVSMLSPVNALQDIHYGEGGVFGGFRAWVAAEKANLRIIEAGLGGVAPTPTTPQILTAPGTIPTTGLQQVVGLNTTGGAFVQPMPTSGVAGLAVTVLDPSKSWSTNAASVSVGAGISIENPAALGGAYVTNGILALPSVSGASYTWIYLPTLSLWKLT